VLEGGGEINILDKFKNILDMNIYYKPTWGIKIDRFGKKEYELYFYNYTPDKRMLDIINTVDIKVLWDKFEINGEYPNDMNYVMYSYDIENDMKSPNFYYVGYTNDHIDYGHSEKNNIMQNKYYRYRVYDIDEIHKKYFEERFIPRDYDSELKVIFLADKLYREYIGIYYDGVKFETLKEMLIKYDIGTELLDNYVDDGCRFSISVDVSKKSGDVVRIGVYGILY